jgi:hypothetical protein
LKNPIQGLIGSQGLPSLRQGVVTAGQFLIADRFEAGQDPNGCKPVQRPLFTVWKQAATAMKNALRMRGVVALGNGIQEGLHVRFQ